MCKALQLRWLDGLAGTGTQPLPYNIQCLASSGNKKESLIVIVIIKLGIVNVVGARKTIREAIVGNRYFIPQETHTLGPYSMALWASLYRHLLIRCTCRGICLRVEHTYRLTWAKCADKHVQFFFLNWLIYTPGTRTRNPDKKIAVHPSHSRPLYIAGSCFRWTAAATCNPQAVSTTSKRSQDS